MKETVSGFSFANLGIFRGFGDGIYNAVYALVLLAIFGNSATVGLYVAIYSAAMMLVTLFANEAFRYFSKANIFHFSMLATALVYFMMGFSVKTGTFITLDYISGITIVFIGLIIPLFMSDFSKNIGMAKLNSRYYLWQNVGALFAPMIAMSIAGNFGERAAFLASGVLYGLGFLMFKYFKIVQEDKKPKKLSPRRTFKSLWRTMVSFFRHSGMTRVYMVSFGRNFLAAMRSLYVPIMVIEQGFSKDTLGIVLTLGIIPYVILSEPMGRLARRYGNRIWMLAGFLSFAGFAFWASFATGWTLLAVFILWQISGALMEPIQDLLFFDATKKDEQAKYYGVFRTSTMLPKFVAPLVGAGFIMFFGGTFAVWLITGVIALMSAWMLLGKK